MRSRRASPAGPPTKICLAQGDNQTAFGHYTHALALWHGPAGHGLSHGSAAVPDFNALNGEFLDACAAAADLATSLGHPHRVLPHLQLAASLAFLHEPVHAGLIATLAAGGAAGRSTGGPSARSAHVSQRTSASIPATFSRPRTSGS